MARILISYFWKMQTEKNGLHVFFGGLVDALEKNGNEILTINTSFINNYKSNRIPDKTINNLLLLKIKEFNPELIIAFNHRVPQCILDNFKDTQTIIWDGDELKYFCDLDYIKENIERYKLFSITTAWNQDYLDFGFKQEQIFHVPAGTSIQARNYIQDKNISFVGSIHHSWPNLIDIINSGEYNKELNMIMQEHFMHPENKNYEELFKKYFKSHYEDLKLEPYHIYPLFNSRLLTLSNLIDMGLHLRGVHWKNLTNIFPQLVATWSPEEIYTLKENEDFYNSSKISIAPIHPQGRGVGFPWRIYDIMASNACLVSEQSSDLKELTKNYVDLPMFHTPWEARDICKNLLNDEKTRKEIVLASQKYINENARWIHRFKDMEKILNIKLINKNKGNFANILLDEEIQDKLNNTKKNKLSLINKYRYKIWKHYNKILMRKGII